ncbi:MAG: hypothetical protein A3B70_01425 [Deltaproteobacteria bacterium RIFCSPHIGHO2_02_FULL_40_11]|nr:MAG: hypothetical protein A3B70_01425 [Deltaproteobacteria bacterium RIFCSPHIGHO2_02_FULL_40_11]
MLYFRVLLLVILLWGNIPPSFGKDSKDCEAFFDAPNQDVAVIFQALSKIAPNKRLEILGKNEALRFDLEKYCADLLKDPKNLDSTQKESAMRILVLISQSHSGIEDRVSDIFIELLGDRYLSDSAAISLSKLRPVLVVSKLVAIRLEDGPKIHASSFTLALNLIRIEVKRRIKNETDARNKRRWQDTDELLEMALEQPQLEALIQKQKIKPEEDILDLEKEGVIIEPISDLSEGDISFDFGHNVQIPEPKNRLHRDAAVTPIQADEGFAAWILGTHISDEEILEVEGIEQKLLSVFKTDNLHAKQKALVLLQNLGLRATPFIVMFLEDDEIHLVGSHFLEQLMRLPLRQGHDTRLVLKRIAENTQGHTEVRVSALRVMAGVHSDISVSTAVSCYLDANDEAVKQQALKTLASLWPLSKEVLLRYLVNQPTEIQKQILRNLRGVQFALDDPEIQIVLEKHHYWKDVLAEDQTSTGQEPMSEFISYEIDEFDPSRPEDSQLLAEISELFSGTIDQARRVILEAPNVYVGAIYHLLKHHANSPKLISHIGIVLAGMGEEGIHMMGDFLASPYGHALPESSVIRLIDALSVTNHELAAMTLVGVLNNTNYPLGIRQYAGELLLVMSETISGSTVREHIIVQLQDFNEDYPTHTVLEDDADEALSFPMVDVLRHPKLPESAQIIRLMENLVPKTHEIEVEGDEDDESYFSFDPVIKAYAALMSQPDVTQLYIIRLLGAHPSAYYKMMAIFLLIDMQTEMSIQAVLQFYNDPKSDPIICRMVVGGLSQLVEDGGVPPALQAQVAEILKKEEGATSILKEPEGLFMAFEVYQAVHVYMRSFAAIQDGREISPKDMARAIQDKNNPYKVDAVGEIFLDFPQQTTRLAIDVYAHLSPESENFEAFLTYLRRNASSIAKEAVAELQAIRAQDPNTWDVAQEERAEVLIDLLGSLGFHAYSAIRPYVESENDLLKADMIEAMGAWGQIIFKYTFLEAAKSNSPKVRQSAHEALCDLSAMDESIPGILAQAYLEEKDFETLFLLLSQMAHLRISHRLTPKEMIEKIESFQKSEDANWVAQALDLIPRHAYIHYMKQLLSTKAKERKKAHKTLMAFHQTETAQNVLGDDLQKLFDSILRQYEGVYGGKSIDTEAQGRLKRMIEKFEQKIFKDEF